MKTVVNSLFACAAVAAMTFAATAQAQDAAKTAKPAAKATPAAKPVARAVASTKVRPLSVTLDLIQPTKIIGTLTDANSLDMRTSFGTANIPLSGVAGIRFASAENASTTVVMLNGDSITGATDVKMVTVETEWGMAQVNGQNISSILFVPGLTWQASDGLNGKRWALVNAKSMAAKTASKAPAAAPATRTPATSQRTTTGRYPVPQPTYRGR